MITFDNRILGLEIAKLKGGIVFFGDNGCALHDSFDTLDAVDLSLTDGVDVSETGVIKNITPSSDPIIPDMTGNSSPSPFVVTASGEDTWSGGGQKWKAFDRENDTGWLHIDEPAWLAIDCGETKSVGSFSVRVRHNYSAPYNGFPNSFAIYGSSDGTTWGLIESYTGLTWSNGELKTFNLWETANYKHFKLDVTDGSTGNVIIAEWQLYPPEDVENVLIVSKKITALSVPASIRCAVVATYSGVLNTDFNIYVSRDDGTTWAKASASKLYDNQDGYAVIDTGNVDVTGQPSGSELRWKIETENGATCEVDGVVIWGEE